MKINELLIESLSRVAYHYTRLPAAAKIMQTGQFQLSSTLGTSSEEGLSKKDYHYFLSTTRTKSGGYHSYLGNDAVMFVLDGNWFNDHYKSAPVDYWATKNPETGEITGNRDPQQLHHRPHEAEDRVFSKTPTIPVDGVSSIHILIKAENTNEYSGGWARTVIINAKKRGIPAYMYDDEDIWRALDTRRAIPLSKNPALRGPQHLVTRQSMYNRKGYLHPWLQLITATDKAQLDKKADSLRHSLQYTYDAHNATQGLGNEMSNARKPGAGIDRENAVKIIDYMRKNNISSIKALVDHLTQKWAPPKS